MGQGLTGNLTQATFDPWIYANFARVIVNTSRLETLKILPSGEPT